MTTLKIAIVTMARKMAAGVACSLVAAGVATAQDAYPNKPVRFIVGSAPGDNTDIFARLLADELKTRLGQPVIVENKPGAAGLLSGSYVSNARPDGYTLLFGHMSSLIVGPQTVSPMPYDSTKAFTPIVKTQQGASIVVVRSGLPVKTFQELIELARSKPKQIRFAVNQLGSTQHLAMEIVQASSGARFNTVPYRGTAASLQATVSGEADIAVASALTAKPHVDSGAIRPLAVYGGKPVAQYPDLPTLGTALNVPRLNHNFWYGVVGPPGLPRTIVDKLSTDIQAAMSAPAMKEMTAKNAQTFLPNSPEEFARSIALEWDLFAKVAKDNKVEMK